MRDRATAALTTVVIDDEQLARDELSYLLKDFPDIDVVATGSNGLQAVDLIRKLEPELVFMDIRMPGLDGMGVVRQLREKTDDLPQFIFVTAYEQHAVEAFRLEAMDYLLKPVRPERLADPFQHHRAHGYQFPPATPLTSIRSGLQPETVCRALICASTCGEHPAIKARLICRAFHGKATRGAQI